MAERIGRNGHELNPVQLIELLDALPVPAAILDRAHNILYRNRAARSHHRETSTDATRVPAPLKEALSPEDLSRQPLGTALDENEPTRLVRHVPLGPLWIALFSGSFENAPSASAAPTCSSELGLFRKALHELRALLGPSESVVAGWDGRNSALPSPCFAIPLREGVPAGLVVRATTAPELLLFLDYYRSCSVLVFAAPQMAALMETAADFARTDLPVLIEGETGTGKELLAALIHYWSWRASRPMVTLEAFRVGELALSSLEGLCSLLEPTGRGVSKGKPHGTLVLERVDELGMAEQARLVGLVDEFTEGRAGRTRSSRQRPRLILTTAQSLQALVEAGQFRRDLYHRLHVLHLRIPPLRQRPEDIVALAHYFLWRFRQENRCKVDSLAPDALELLRVYPWPGNARELQWVLYRACLRARSAALTKSELVPVMPCAATTAKDWYSLTLAEAELALAQAALQATGGNRAAAARKLGISVRRLSAILRPQRKHL
jgi:hypothetical protein